MRDLFITTHTPALSSGRGLRTYGVVRALAMHGEVDLLYVRFETPEPDPAFKAIRGIALYEVIPSRGLRRLLCYGAARLSRVPAEFARGASLELMTEAARLACRPERGRVIADGPVAAAALARLAHQQPVIYNAHNFESGFRSELSGARRRDHKSLRRFERGLLERASESWMVSEGDIAAARSLCPQARLRYMPNVVDVTSIVPLQPRAERHTAIFVANFTYAPNRNGLSFLLDEVFPRVWAELPDAKVMLVGAGLDDLPISDPRVERLGFVDDLRQSYAQATCVVVPLLQGGGTPLKLIEGLSYGLPVIATSRAVARLAVRNGEHCLIADGPDAFATALSHVLQGGAPDLGNRGREFVSKHHSIETLSELLDE